jgi:hypothetical protein
MCVDSSVFAMPFSGINAAYDIYKGSIKIGKISESFVVNKNHYSITSITQAVGLLALFKPGEIVIKSSGLITEQGLQPLHFSDFRAGDESRNRGAEFNWSDKSLILTHDGQKYVVPLLDGTQDRLSAMYQFMYLKFNKAGLLSFNMTNGSKSDVYNYHVEVDQKVSIPIETFKSVYLASIPEADASRTEIWLAVTHKNFPYKMNITNQDGDILTQVLTKIDFIQ